MNKIEYVSTPVEGVFILKIVQNTGGEKKGIINSLIAKDLMPNIVQISLSVSQKGVLRGFHRSSYSKIVNCIEGKVYDVIVDLRTDSPTYLRKVGVELQPGVTIFVPPGCGHGFYSLEDSNVLYLQGGSYNKEKDCEVSLFDPQINVDWPPVPEHLENYIISKKDENNVNVANAIENLLKPLKVKIEQESVEYLIFGGSGYFGTEVIRALTKTKKTFFVSNARMEYVNELIEALDNVKPKYVICAAGIAGRPNIDWCETHRPETVMANVIGQINIANECLKRDIHCVLFGTGSLYCYDEEHPLGSGKGFVENDEPISANFYVKCRIQEEKLLKHFRNVLLLRVVFPMSDDMHERSVVSKLLKYPKIMSVPTAYTVMDDLFPLIPKMAELRRSGVYNFTNPGVSSNEEILTLYKKYVDPSHNWVSIPSDQSASLSKAKRLFSELDVTKLLKDFPNIPSIGDSIKEMFIRVRDSKK